MATSFCKFHRYVIGLDEEEQCQLSKHCDSDPRYRRYCINTKDGLDTCAPFDDAGLCYMDNDEYRFCPVNVTGLCKATVRNPDKMWFRTKDAQSCPNGMC